MHRASTLHVAYAVTAKLTEHLSVAELNASFVFTVTRDPVERFYSGLCQTAHEEGWRREVWSRADVEDVLERMRSGACRHQVCDRSTPYLWPARGHRRRRAYRAGVGVPVLKNNRLGESF